MFLYTQIFCSLSSVLLFLNDELNTQLPNDSTRECDVMSRSTLGLSVAQHLSLLTVHIRPRSSGCMRRAHFHALRLPVTLLTQCTRGQAGQRRVSPLHRPGVRQCKPDPDQPGATAGHEILLTCCLSLSC